MHQGPGDSGRAGAGGGTEGLLSGSGFICKLLLLGSLEAALRAMTLL